MVGDSDTELSPSETREAVPLGRVVVSVHSQVRTASLKCRLHEAQTRKLQLRFTSKL